MEAEGYQQMRRKRGVPNRWPTALTKEIARLVDEVEIHPAQVNRLADPQPMPIHHCQQQLIALPLPTHPASGIDQPAAPRRVSDICDLAVFRTSSVLPQAIKPR